MLRGNRYRHLIHAICAALAIAGIACLPQAASAVPPPANMADYTAYPPFITENAPPLVMLNMGRDHKLYYEAFTDTYDLDEDGRIETTYNHKIDYYGYFDAYKCYTYSGSGGSALFTPVSTNTDKFCSAGRFSGNVLNWLTMSRMDVIRRVLYGGHRVTDSSSQTVLERVFIPQDAHSWGKEYTGRLCSDGSTHTNMCSTSGDCDTGFSCVDKSTSLLGIAASSAPQTCEATAAAWDRTGQILLVTYNHDSSKTCSATHVGLMNSFEPQNYLSHSYITDFSATAIRPNQDHGNNLNYFLVSEFEVIPTEAGNWQFGICADQYAEIEIDGTVCNPLPCNNANQTCNNPTSSCMFNLATGWHRLIVRHFESTGRDGVRVWYDKPGGGTSWVYYGDTLNIRSPNIQPGNECGIQTVDFITTGTPSTGPFTIGSPRYHLICNTTTTATGSPIFRLLLDKNNRIWEWASKERPVCDTSLGTPTDYTVRVEVCKAGLTESNCKYYPGSGGLFKPIGLLQKYGEGDGSKVCSKVQTKACNTDSDCDFATEGICIEKAGMYYGFMTGSYSRNMSGGVLRKNVWTILDETNANTGIFQTSENVEGNIIITIDRMKTIDFSYTDYSYSCGWITGRPMNEAECKMWGNPVAEMLYESTRYLADRGSPTADFTYGTPGDSGVNLSKPDWIKPYDYYPACSKPFVLTISDVNPSYDSDKVPGSSFGGIGGDLPGLNSTTLANTIGTDEGIAGTKRFIGESSFTDFLCTSKGVSNLGSIRGLCPEEPTKQGSFYSSAVAYYGRTKLKENTGKENIIHFTVALSSPVPDINLKLGGKSVRFVPTGKSVTGCFDVSTNCNCTFTRDANGLHMSNCSGYCPTNQIVDYYIERITYDASNNLQYAKFRINFEDVEQGADHDMDAIVSYEIEPDPDDPDNKLIVTLTSEYAAGCIGQAMGFAITGTTEDGVYLPVRDADTATSDTRIGALPLTWTKTFSVSGNAAETIESPLWYASKWGGFDDYNQTGKPDSTQKWDADGNGVPDTYFLVVNPQKMEQQMDKAFSDILKRAASGTAASVLATTGEGEGAVYQAYFFPRKTEGDEQRKWLGYIHGLFLDPYGNLREDTNSNKTLEGIDSDDCSGSHDYIIRTRYDQSTGTLVDRFDDADCDGQADDGTDPFSTPPNEPHFKYVDTISLENVHSIWNGGNILWSTDQGNRNIYTTVDGTTLVPFTIVNAPTLWKYLRANDAVEGAKIIAHARGEDIPGYRKRTITLDGQTKVWKLGDIIYSTPTPVARPAENYDLLYGDASYSKFRKTYFNRRNVIYVGANDGMIHAFNAGFYDTTSHKFWRSYSGGTYSDAGPELGEELSAFIPRELLPHLKWLADPDYTHVYYVDLKPKVTDVQIFTEDASHPGGWGTVLIAGMRYGGKTIPTEVGNFRSTYFAFDITNPEDPASYGRLLWTFDTTDTGATDLGLTLSYPAVAKVEDNWFALFGSGPTNFDKLSNLTGFQTGKVFVLDISGGSNGVINSWTRNSNYWTLEPASRPAGYSGDFMANPITIDGNVDFNVDVSYIGENYKVSGRKRATMWRLLTGKSTDPSKWKLSELFTADPAKDSSNRITASPSAMMDKHGYLWLYFGTGQFLGSDDKNQSDTGAFYGIREKDGCWDGTKAGCPPGAAYSNLQDVSNTIICYGGGTDCAGGTSFNTLRTDIESKDGWAIYFNNMSVETSDFLGNTLKHEGERVTNKPAILGGFVMFTSYVPGGDICTIEGTSNQYSLYYATGTAYTKYAFKKEHELEGESQTQSVSRTAYLGKGLPASIGLAVTKEGKLKGFVQKSTGDIQPIQESDPKAPRSGVIGWKISGVGGLE